MVSIGSSGSSMGPVGALENFGGNSGGKRFDRRLLVRLLAFLKPHWRRLLLALVITLVTSGLALAAPYLIKVAIDTDIGGKDIVGLWRTAGLLLATFIALFFATWGQQYLLSWVGERVLATMRDQLFRHLQALQLGYHDTHIVGVTIFAQETASEERFDQVNAASRDANIDAMNLSFVFLPSVELISMIATAAVLWFGGRAVAAGELTLGVVVALLAYVTRFFQPIQELSQLYTTMQAAMAGGERVHELLDTPLAVRDLRNGAEMPPIRGVIELRDVSFAYREGEPVLHDVTLHVEPGQTVALVGPTGAGKTSIANLVARFYDVTDGAVLIDGVDVRSVTQASLRQQFGLAPQDAFLFSGTVADNIRFSRPEASDEEVEAAARLANAHAFIMRLPGGYHTEIWEGGVNLSAGERQLISIARAALAQPRILILDEATSSADTVTELLIQEALERLLAGRTALVIAHGLSTIRKADLICVVNDGRIVERGTHEELLVRGGLYRDLYNRQFLLASAPAPRG